jgi:hypothetical protein
MLFHDALCVLQTIPRAQGCFLYFLIDMGVYLLILIARYAESLLSCSILRQALIQMHLITLHEKCHLEHHYQVILPYRHVSAQRVALLACSSPHQRSLS